MGTWCPWPGKSGEGERIKMWLKSHCRHQPGKPNRLVFLFVIN